MWAARLSATSSWARRSSRSSSSARSVARRRASASALRAGVTSCEDVHPPHQRAGGVADRRRRVLDRAPVHRLGVVDRLARGVVEDRQDAVGVLLGVGEAPLDALVDDARASGVPTSGCRSMPRISPAARLASDRRPRRSLTMTPIRLDEITPSSVWRLRRVRAASWWLRAVRAIWGASVDSSSTYAAGTGLSRVRLHQRDGARARAACGVPIGTATPLGVQHQAVQRAGRAALVGQRARGGRSRRARRPAAARPPAPRRRGAASPRPMGSRPSGVSRGASACAAGEGPTQ